MEPTYKHAAKCPAPLFLVTFNAATQMFVGTFLLLTSIWSLAHKLQYYGTFMDIKMDALFFGVAAGFLIVPVVVLAVMLRRNRTKHFIMILGIALFSLSLLFSGYFIGTIYLVPTQNQTLHMGSSIPTEILNKTLYYFIDGDEEKMDGVQGMYQCCGVDKKEDFVEIPDSCCPQNNCSDNGVYTRGCLRVIQEDVAWHQHLTVSFMQMFILLYFFNLSMVTIVFISDRYKRKKQTQPNR